MLIRTRLRHLILVIMVYLIRSLLSLITAIMLCDMVSTQNIICCCL
jgi:hypothetical protein